MKDEYFLFATYLTDFELLACFCVVPLLFEWAEMVKTEIQMTANGDSGDLHIIS